MTMSKTLIALSAALLLMPAATAETESDDRPADLCVLTYYADLRNAGSINEHEAALLKFVECSTEDQVFETRTAGADAADLCVLNYYTDVRAASNINEHEAAVWKFVDCTLTDSIKIGIVSEAAAGKDIAGLCVLNYYSDLRAASNINEHEAAVWKFADCTLTDSIEIRAVSDSTAGAANLCALTYYSDLRNAGSINEHEAAIWKFVDCTLTDSVELKAVSGSTVPNLCALTYYYDLRNAGSINEHEAAVLKFADCTLTDFVALPDASETAAGTGVADLCVLTYYADLRNAGSINEHEAAIWKFVDCTLSDSVELRVLSDSTTSVADLCVLTYYSELRDAHNINEHEAAIWKFVDCTLTDSFPTDVAEVAVLLA